VLLVEDDHLGPVAGAPMHSLAPGSGPWAAARSVAKSLGPDVRLALLSGDPVTLARVRGRQACGPGWVSHVLQRLVHELWSDPAVEALIGRAAASYTERRERLLAELRARGVAAVGSSGLNVWVAVGDEAGALAALMQRGWLVAPGARYRLPGSAPAIRITCATLELEESARLAGELAELLAPSRTSRSG
jgi:DNA-binding transcriptional MocR family regulator